MQIVFQGKQSTEEATEGLLNILNLFRERYGIDSFRDVRLDFSMLDRQGDIVDLIDPVTFEVFTLFEVCKTGELVEPSINNPPQKNHLRLVVDNTKATKQA